MFLKRVFFRIVKIPVLIQAVYAVEDPSISLEITPFGGVVHKDLILNGVFTAHDHRHKADPVRVV